ncbi:TPA: hypothetical protein DCW54_01535 [Candidatus Dependentiae bacterium]|nr:hypothetical protein [Candidatus Dependentiae bacterium]
MSKKPNKRCFTTAASGFSFIEIMGALLIFSLLGTTLIVSQGAMMRAVGRIVRDIEAFSEGRVALNSALRAGSLYLKEDATTKTIEETGKLSEVPLELFVQAFEKEGPFKDFVPGAFGRVMQKNVQGDWELFVFIVGPNYSAPQDPRADSSSRKADDGARASGKPVQNGGQLRQSMRTK